MDDRRFSAPVRLGALTLPFALALPGTGDAGEELSPPESVTALLPAPISHLHDPFAAGAARQLRPALRRHKRKIVRHARITRRGRVLAPTRAPRAVRRVIAAANRIATKPYVYGGGHGSWNAAGYDCSGSVSYALHGGGLLRTAMASGGFTSWGRPGRGRWITVYANGGHAYMVVAGLRYDTTSAKATGNRWTSQHRAPAGYVARHPAGL